MMIPWEIATVIIFLSTTVTMFEDCIGEKIRLVLPSVTNAQLAWVNAVLLVCGSLTVARWTLRTLSVLVQTFVLPGKSLKRFGAGKGSWAVVTGASDGIGREFAVQLAKAGFNVVLVARNYAALSATADEIATQTKSRVSTKIHLIDFAEGDEKPVDEFAELCKGLDIGVLVNNVGRGHSMPVYFAETPKQEMEDIINININGTLRITSAVLPGMISRKRGLILNVGSFAGAVPSAMLATYSGSKAFLATFSSALAEEVRAHNIVVQNLNTYFVVSKLSKIRKSSLLVPTPKAYVRSVLSKIGLPCGAAHSGRPSNSTPYWSHALLDYLITIVGCKSFFIRHTHKAHIDIRRRALKKAEREAKGQ